MVKRLLALSLVLCAVVAFVGCVYPIEGLSWAPIMSTTTPLEIGDPTVGMDNVGTAEQTGIILVVEGDASISAAMKNGENGDITKIHHADLETLYILGVYSKQIVTVYGE